MIVSLADILLYVGEGVRPIIEGEQVLLAGHILLCGQVGEKIVGLCLQSSHMRDKPHKIQLQLADDYKQWLCHCTCKAGAGGKCKHIVGLLLHLNRSDTLTELSCTELEQKWGKTKNQKTAIEVVPIEQLCHVGAVKTLPDFDLSECQKFVDNCLNAANDSEAALHPQLYAYRKQSYCESQVVSKQNFKRHYQANAIFEINSHKSYCSFFCAGFFFICYRKHEDQDWQNIIQHSQRSNIFAERLYNQDIMPLQKCCITTYNKLYPCESIDICRKTFRNEIKWQQERQFRVTASRCYSLYTFTKKDWVKKCDAYFWPPHINNVYTIYSEEQEKYARRAYEREKNIAVLETGLIVCQSNSWLACSPDRIIVSNNQPEKVLEIKCPYIGKQKTILECLPNLPFLKCTDHVVLNKRHQYYGQVQLQMCILNLKETDFMIYASFDQSFYIVTVPLDYVFCCDLLTKLKSNYFEHMLPNLCIKLK